MKRSCHHEQVTKSNTQSNYRMGKATKTKTTKYRSSHPKVFLVEDVLKICSKFTGEHPCRSVISIKLRCNFIEVTLWHGCSPVNLLDIFRTPFPKNTTGWLLRQRLLHQTRPLLGIWRFVIEWPAPFWSDSDNLKTFWMQIL